MRLLFVIIIFLITAIDQAIGYQRVVVLNTAAGSILKEMALDRIVVGVSFNDDSFKNAARVGSHLSPNIELIKALNPDLIIAGSKRAFPDKLKSRFQAELFRYDPRTLEDILQATSALGRLLDRESQASIIVRRRQQMLSALRTPREPISVVFEISERPLKVAGEENIVSSIITAAGGTNGVSISKKHVMISPERILEIKPDFYLFQNGPMNKNPIHPMKRSYFKSLHCQFVEVDQLMYTRPGLNAFMAAKELNKIFTKDQN